VPLDKDEKTPLNFANSLEVWMYPDQDLCVRIHQNMSFYFIVSLYQMKLTLRYSFVVGRVQIDTE